MGNNPSPTLNIASFLLDGLDPDEGLAEAEVVDQDAVVQVKIEVPGGQRVEDVALVVLAFEQVLAVLVGPLEVRTPIGSLQLVDLCTELGLEFAKVLVEHGVQCCRGVAVQVDQRVEDALAIGARGEHPVDRAVRVALAVVLVWRS